MKGSIVFGAAAIGVVSASTALGLAYILAKPTTVTPVEIVAQPVEIVAPKMDCDDAKRQVSEAVNVKLLLGYNPMLPQQDTRWGIYAVETIDSLESVVDYYGRSPSHIKVNLDSIIERMALEVSVNAHTLCVLERDYNS